MVYKDPDFLRLSLRGPCERDKHSKRLINTGTKIEQKAWEPTKRNRRIAAEPLTGKPSYKTIPSYIGPNVVDSRKKSYPAYTLSKRISKKVSLAEGGPDKFNIRGLCNKGLQRAPAFSLKSRCKDIQKFKPPPPNKYFIDNAVKATTKSIPTYSFGKRPTAQKTLPTPAPNVYNLPPVFGTAKEGQIKAAPAFTMLGRAKARQIPVFQNPGPGDYEHNYRYCQKVSPRYSMHTKHKLISDEHMKPGPGAHCPESYYKHKSVPAPSFSIQHTPYAGVRKACLMRECKQAAKPEWLL